MKKLALAATAALLVSAAAVAQQPTTKAGDVRVLTTLPENSLNVTHFYKESVYDPSDAKIGEVSDLLVDHDGKVAAAIVAVGGFLGVGEKDVAVPFRALHRTQKDNKWRLVMNTTKDELKSAPGFKYDRSNSRWVAEARK